MFKSAADSEWVSALTRTISAIFRRGGSVDFLADELEQVYSATGGQFMKGKYVPSKVAMLGAVIRQHLAELKGEVTTEPEEVTEGLLVNPEEPERFGEICPDCNRFTLFSMEGCEKCIQCGYSTCG